MYESSTVLSGQFIIDNQLGLNTTFKFDYILSSPHIRLITPNGNKTYTENSIKATDDTTFKIITIKIHGVSQVSRTVLQSTPFTTYLSFNEGNN